MAQPEPVEFAGLLRRYREAARLTQAELAQRAGLSVRGLSDLERGARRTPHPDTVLRLAASLGLDDGQQRAFLAARLGRGTVRRTHASLPRPLTSFVGRDRDVAALSARLTRTRLVTITGPGGIGKTRVAVEVAWTQIETRGREVYFVDFAPLVDPSLVSDTVAATLGVAERSALPVARVIVRAIDRRDVLLVLDNCEHVLGPCSELIDALLADCPRVRVLSTSRGALGRTDELVWPLAPLDTRSGRDADAVRLFFDRIRSAAPWFTFDEPTVAVVGDICQRLDGLPLAIELAAARAPSLGLSNLAARLDQRLHLLKSGPQGTTARHSTLQAALDWSYGLLTPLEQLLFRRLSVFAGGFSLDGAEAVAGDLTLTAAGVDDGMMRLVDQSLIEVQPADGSVRYRLLETIRTYGREQLATAELAAIRRRHADYFLAVVERIQPRLIGPEQAALFATLESDHDNLRSVLSWSLETNERAIGLRLAASLWRLWQVHGHLHEGRAWLERLLTEPVAEPRLEARALNAAGNLAYYQGEHHVAAALYERSLALRELVGDLVDVATSLNNLGDVARARGDYDAARTLMERSLALRRELDDRWGVAATLNNLGVVARAQRDPARAAALYEESLAIKRQLGDTWGTAASLTNLGNVARDRGDYATALTYQQESLAMLRAMGDERSVANVLPDLAAVASYRGDYASAVALFIEALDSAHRLGFSEGIARAIEGLATLAAIDGWRDRAARLFGAAEVLRAAIGAPRVAADEAYCRPYEDDLRRRLPGERMERRLGGALPLDRVISTARVWAAELSFPPTQGVRQ